IRPVPIRYPVVSHKRIQTFCCSWISSCIKLEQIKGLAKHFYLCFCSRLSSLFNLTEKFWPYKCSKESENNHNNNKFNKCKSIFIFVMVLFFFILHPFLLILT